MNAKAFGLHKEKLQNLPDSLRQVNRQAGKVHHEHQPKFFLVAHAYATRAEKIRVRAVRGRQPHGVLIGCGGSLVDFDL
jgi:hypothetical protein